MKTSSRIAKTTNKTAKTTSKTAKTISKSINQLTYFSLQNEHFKRQARFSKRQARFSGKASLPFKTRDLCKLMLTLDPRWCPSNPNKNAFLDHKPHWGPYGMRGRYKINALLRFKTLLGSLRNVFLGFKTPLGFLRNAFSSSKNTLGFLEDVVREAPRSAGEAFWRPRGV